MESWGVLMTHHISQEFQAEEILVIHVLHLLHCRAYWSALLKFPTGMGGHGSVTTDGWVLVSQNNCVSYLSVSLSGFDAQICIQSVISICRPL